MKTAITLLEADTPACSTAALPCGRLSLPGNWVFPPRWNGTAGTAWTANAGTFSSPGAGRTSARCAACPRRDGTLRLQRFCIRRDCRGQGAGRQTLREVEERFRREGFSAVALDAKCSAQGFYTACGYETVSGPFLEAGVLHVAMQRPL